jgi:hypothetical protein
LGYTHIFMAKGTNKWTSYSANSSSHPQWVQNLKINLLNAQTALWYNGIRPWTFSYFLNQ